MASKYVYGRSVPTAYLRQKHRISRYVHTITSYEPSMLLPTANLRQKYNHYNYVETLSLFKWMSVSGCFYVLSTAPSNLVTITLCRKQMYIILKTLLIMSTRSQ